jgi:4-hydroxy-tetrahydrodipicolinate reductase
MIRLGVVGASGRTGARILEVVHEFPALQLTVAVTSSNSAGRSVSLEYDQRTITFVSDHSLLAACDVVIDFSTPESSVRSVEACASCGVPILIATTGLSSSDRSQIEVASKRCAVVMASNTSLGILAVREAISAVKRVFSGLPYECSVSDIHHRGKRDAPSGTAKLLVSELGKAAPIASFRGGDEPGEHTVFFFLNGERVELTHRVTDRRVFARGALEGAFRLFGRLPGLYDLKDLCRASA